MEFLFIQSQAWGLMFFGPKNPLRLRSLICKSLQASSPFQPIAFKGVLWKTFNNHPLPTYPSTMHYCNKSGFSHNRHTASWSTNKNSLISSSVPKKHNTSIVFVSGNCGSPVSQKKTRCSGGQVLSICLVFDQKNTTELGIFDEKMSFHSVLHSPGWLVGMKNHAVDARNPAS